MLIKSGLRRFRAGSQQQTCHKGGGLVALIKYLEGTSSIIRVPDVAVNQMTMARKIRSRGKNRNKAHPASKQYQYQKARSRASKQTPTYPYYTDACSLKPPPAVNILYSRSTTLLAQLRLPQSSRFNPQNSERLPLYPNHLTVNFK